MIGYFDNDLETVKFSPFQDLIIHLTIRKKWRNLLDRTQYTYTEQKIYYLSGKNKKHLSFFLS